ncbi:unnamed protein product [Moneuplotes crassus]|uniref:Uncharacterized protein n=1 Tax=Euplotes crassus TaxID=5936 RepID=A0AAD1UP41_EUPCR|nr:unnamed protein product [Moneuplotes crassus]
MSVYFPTENELINCPITGDLRIGKNLDNYGRSGGAAGTRTNFNHNTFKQRLGDTAMTFSSASGGQNRVRDYLTKSGVFHPKLYRNDAIPLLRDENATNGRLSENKLIKSVARRSLSNHRIGDTSLYLEDQDYINLRQTFDRNSKILREKRRMKEPSKYGDFFSNESFQRNNSQMPHNSDSKVPSTLQRFSPQETQSKPKFQHNLMLPTRNGREFKKLLSGSKNKFLEMMKNKHRLDTINFKPAKNTATIKPMAEEILERGSRYKSMDEKATPKPHVPRRNLNNYTHLANRASSISRIKAPTVPMNSSKTIESPAPKIEQKQTNIPEISSKPALASKSILKRTLNKAYKTTSFPKMRNSFAAQPQKKEEIKIQESFASRNADQISNQNITNYPTTIPSSTIFPKRTAKRAMQKGFAKTTKVIKPTDQSLVG